MIEPAIIPVMLRKGVPMFTESGMRTRLVLTRHSSMGAVLLGYEVVK